DTHEAVLRWPHIDAKEVIVSGDFDQWSNSVHLAKDESGFAAKVKIPWGAKVEYKFLVDGQWKTSDAPVETDPSGRYTNNVFIAPPKPVSSVSAAISYVASGLGAA
ncbi:carbohydrate-binding module family 48 protein, partial [Piloderma croceum F 1598]